ncbi:hypothetical protein MYAM1_003963 [Malassezia yamatoensis]|uniref:Arylamine N-acetyltransferase n=1 Tax=Malassezia yamatoensis TaxID=253288 RepID=A0AAJ6CJG2_9BASI|nr:hypothetical protein MYAM1_003963 [Malassezia yamatoensis]
MAWETSTLDIDAYLRRISHPKLNDTTKEALRSVCKAHVLAIPFENLDSASGVKPCLGLKEVQEKLVYHQRGGYCFEHITLFAAVLERLGFQLNRRLSRMFPDLPGPTTHVLVEVKTRDSDKEWLADVGFGGGMIEPMPIASGAIVDQLGIPHRLVWKNDFWQLEKKQKDGKWSAQHAWSQKPVYPIDFFVMNHYIATCPDSPFYGRPVVWRIKDGQLVQLTGTLLTTTHADDSETKRNVTASEAPEVLESLGLHLDSKTLDRVLKHWPSS